MKFREIAPWLGIALVAIGLIGMLIFPIYFGDFVFGGIGVAVLALLAGWLLCGTSGERVSDWRPITWLVVVLWLVAGHLYGCFATIGLKHQFADVVEHGMSSEIYGEGSDLHDVGLNYYGGLDAVVARRKAHLAKQGTIYWGAWWSGDKWPSSCGIYFWVGPLANLNRREHPQ